MQKFDGRLSSKHGLGSGTGRLGDLRSCPSFVCTVVCLLLSGSVRMKLQVRWWGVGVYPEIVCPSDPNIITFDTHRWRPPGIDHLVRIRCLLITSSIGCQGRGVGGGLLYEYPEAGAGTLLALYSPPPPTLSRERMKAGGHLYITTRGL